jgi:hypothetical protein
MIEYTEAQLFVQVVMYLEFSPKGVERAKWQIEDAVPRALVGDLPDGSIPATFRIASNAMGFLALWYIVRSGWKCVLHEKYYYFSPRVSTEETS